MIDAPPEKTIPVPDPTDQLIAIVGDPPTGVLEWIEPLFGCKTTRSLAVSVGLIYFGDGDAPLARSVIEAMDYFFDKHGSEALVYRFRPCERDFQIVTRSWLDCRR